MTNARNASGFRKSLSKTAGEILVNLKVYHGVHRTWLSKVKIVACSTVVSGKRSEASCAKRRGVYWEVLVFSTVRWWKPVLPRADYCLVSVSVPILLKPDPS